ncbi:hypothetical protein Tco_1028155 [Tanacetum coccineum]
MKNDFETSMAKQTNELKNMMASFFQIHSPSGSGSLPSNTIANPRGDLKAITTRSDVSYDEPMIPPTSSPLPKEVLHPRVPLILGRPFLRTARALIDVHREELIHRDEYEQLIFHVDNTSKHPHESIIMINFIDTTCEDHFSEVLKFKKSNHPSSGSTIPFSNSLLEEFVDELALQNPFPPGNEDDNFDPEAEFTDEPAHVYSPPPGDDNDDIFTTSLLDLPTDLVPIPRESEDTFEVNKECDLPFSVTFSNPLFDFNDDFTSSDDESLPEEDVQEENFKIYSNPLFEFDDEYIFSDVNPLFNEVLEDIENKDSYVSNFDKSALLVTSLSDANEDECFDPGGDIDEINAFLDMDVSTDFEGNYYDSGGDIIYRESLLIKDTIPNLPP